MTFHLLGWYVELNETFLSFSSNSDYKKETFICRQPMSIRSTSLGAFTIDQISTSPQPVLRKIANNNRLVVYLDDKFAVIYFCREAVPVKMESAWVLSRDKIINEADFKIIQEKLIRKGIDVLLADVNQADCPDVKEEVEAKRIEAEKNKENERLFLECMRKFSDAKSGGFTYCKNYYKTQNWILPIKYCVTSIQKRFTDVFISFFIIWSAP